MADDILIRFRAESGNLKAELDGIEKGLKDVETQEKKLGATTKTVNKEIVDSTKKVSDQTKATNAEIKNQAKQFDVLGNSIKNVGSLILAAFSVHQVIAFGKASFDAFVQAEKTAKVLQTAVGVNGGLQADYEELIRQSKELQAISIFSDDDIQKAQTMALQFGLTTKQVKSLLPVISDFASATGQSLNNALEAVLRGTEGMARGLKIYGVQVDATGTKSERLASITQQLTDKFQGQSEVVGETTFGAVEKLKNKYNDLQEEVGSFITDVGEATSALILFVANGFKPLNEEADTTVKKLDAVGQKLNNLLPKAFLEIQIANLRKAGEAIPTELLDRLNKIKFDEFNAEIQKLDDKGLIKKFNDLQAAAEKFDALSIAGQSFAPSGDLQKQLDAIRQLIEARKIEGQLLDDQNKKNVDSTKDALQKELEARKQAQEALKEFTFRSLEDNITDEFTARRTVASQLITDEQKLAAELLQIEIDELNARKANLIEFGKSTADIDRQIGDKIIEQNKQKNKILKADGEIHPTREDFDKSEDEWEDYFENIKQQARDGFASILGFVVDATNSIAGLLEANGEKRIESIDATRDKQLEALDAELQALEDKNNKGRISDEAYEKKRRDLIDRRAVAEKNYDAQVRKLKREQAKADKLLAIFNITLNTAAAIVKALPNLLLAALAGAAGAIQLGVAIATPLPAFKGGTKRKQGGGLARVGEVGEEIVFLPDRAKVLPAKQSKQHSEFIDAMFDNRLDDLIYKTYVLPALKAQSQSVNVNINERKLAKAISESQKDSVNIGNLHELADYMGGNNLRRRI